MSAMKPSINGFMTLNKKLNCYGNSFQMDFWMKKGEIKKVKVEGKRAKRINAIAASTIEGIQAPFLYEGSCNG